ncbi:putative sensor domain DACNV-containing protein [Mucilaginibacter myungsuensis]|uniref:Probable sensor domain-containing protein n=1 Tax=Mucilaginibacter myungsuensis TaxID=649104 RepID=A0A929PX77_9SPHI|nr:hypothetical protein [Mucilaginibacter myungsuensis]MBE9663573.1 hypothetical protein [Mucilaginibacter myungsuensis]MDN3599103.1 hypothetical protein [Mucilaginibacter myungsuensis]
MLSEPSYLPARMVAQKIETHLLRHLDDARYLSELLLADIPSASMIESMVDIGFWASLRREEGQPPKISMAFLSPEQAGSPLVFANRLRLTPKNLTKLAPAVVQPGIHLGVWLDEDNSLYVWGTTHEIPGICFVLEVVEPGLLVIKHRRTDGFGKFVNIAVLRGDEIKIIDEHNISLDDCPGVIESLLEMPLPSAPGDTFNVLVELSTAMRAHNRGGLVLIVPTGSDAWQSSIIQPINYPVDPPFCAISDLLKEPKHKRNIAWKQSLRNAIDIIGGFTAVDGATIINKDNELLAFGAKIARSELSIPVDQMIMTEPVTDGKPIYMHPAQNGGTRHLAAAQFVYDQRDAQAMVASVDGHFTLFAWSHHLNMVHAHRIDILLM